MRTEKLDHSAELAHQAKNLYLEHAYCQMIREMHQTIHISGLENFTLTFIDTLLNDLRTVLYTLEHLPEVTFKELIAVVMGLAEARKELRLARFLFEVEEINPVRRLVLRNKAVLRGKDILHRVLFIWPYYNSPHE